MSYCPRIFLLYLLLLEMLMALLLFEVKMMENQMRLLMENQIELSMVLLKELCLLVMKVY